jgi:hypothetical protein
MSLLTAPSLFFEIKKKLKLEINKGEQYVLKKALENVDTFPSIMYFFLPTILILL